VDVLERVKNIDKSSWITSNVSRGLFADVENQTTTKFAKYYLYAPTDDKYINIREVYLTYNDPTEYDFIIGAFGSVRLWNKIKDSWYMKDVLASMRDELYVRLKSKSLRQIAELAADPDTKETTKLNALKWMATKGYGEVEEISSPKMNRFRHDPNGKEARVKDSVRADMERLGLKVVGNV